MLTSVRCIALSDAIAFSRYRTTADVLLPFTVSPMLQMNGESSMNLTVNLKGDFDKKHSATAVQVTIPIPTHAAKVSVSCKSGKAKYKPGQNSVIWKMRTFAGGKSVSCEVNIELLKVLTTLLCPLVHFVLFVFWFFVVTLRTLVGGASPLSRPCSMHEGRRSPSEPSRGRTLLLNLC